MAPTCPQCGERGVPLLFGLPIAEARDAESNGDLALGGCVEPLEPLNWQCPNKHRWHQVDDDLWEKVLLDALAAHGYDASNEQTNVLPEG